MLALRYEREVIIVGTSVLGGILSGFATAKLSKMDEIPFGIIFSVGFALIGMLIQFALNKPKDDEDDADDEEEENRFGNSQEAMRASREQRRKRLEEYDQDEDDSLDPDDDLSDADDEEIDEILDEYGVDEDEVIEEYLEDYYGENKKKKQKR